MGINGKSELLTQNNQRKKLPSYDIFYITCRVIRHLQYVVKQIKYLKQHEKHHTQKKN